jgi:hypothetical protein
MSDETTDLQNYNMLCLAEISHTAEIKRLTDERAVVRSQLLANPLVLARAEGSTHSTSDRFKVTTTGRMNRKVVESEYREIETDIPKELSPFVRKLTLDLKKLRALELANPELHRYCCRAIEETPGSVGVSVEESN